MTADDPSGKSPPDKDRSLGLIIFGALQLLMGACCAMLIPLMCLSLLAGPAAASTNLRMLIPAFVMYGILAVLLIGLGVGSILCRGWARALTLVLAWMWFVMGLVASTTLIFWMPAAF